MSKEEGISLTEHFFRKEYGRMVSVITKYLGVGYVETAEDIVQETLVKAVDHWQQHGVPENPQAWLYTVAKNLTINIQKRKKHQHKFESGLEAEFQNPDTLQFSESVIEDEQLKMMFVCCHPSISEESQIALILKILCGFSIAEIASAFFTSTETINKRLVRGRKQLRQEKIIVDKPEDLNQSVSVVLKTIYLLFNEGYSPADKHEVIRFDLCTEAIRLTELVINNQFVEDYSEAYGLLALMYLNAARFESRTNAQGLIIEMEKQDRAKWNKYLIDQGVDYLDRGMKLNQLSKYMILAAISANHCVAKTFEDTNWAAILSLYDDFLQIEDTPMVRLNRAIALSKARGNQAGIQELLKIKSQDKLHEHYLFYTALAELYRQENDLLKAKKFFEKALLLTSNERNIKYLRKKISELVLIS